MIRVALSYFTPLCRIFFSLYLLLSESWELKKKKKRNAHILLLMAFFQINYPLSFCKTHFSVIEKTCVCWIQPCTLSLCSVRKQALKMHPCQRLLYTRNVMNGEQVDSLILLGPLPVNLEMLVRENPSRLTVCETHQQSWQVQSHLNPSFAPLWHLHQTSPSHPHLFHRPECNELQACDWPILATVRTGFSFLLRFNLNFGSTCLRPP